MNESSGNDKIVVVDTDAGVDDAWALLMLLAAPKNGKIKLEGITCCHGNTDLNNVSINVLRTLESCGRTDIPVFLGASSPLIVWEENADKPVGFFGADGFGCAKHNNIPDIKLIKEENAVLAMNRIVNENKGEVSLLCLGPLTNVALAIRTFPDFEKNVKELLLMGGNYTAWGSHTDCAEFNFHADPEAAQIVLNSAIRHKVVVPWETCYELIFPLEWRDNVLGACDNASIQLMNHVDEPQRSNPNFKAWMPCDQVVAGVLLEPKMVIESKAVHLTVELGGKHTRGQGVMSRKSKRPPNISLIKHVDQSVLETTLLTTHTL